MTPPVTTWTTCANIDPEYNGWVEGSHSEDRMPQYNFSNIASAQEANQATAVGDQHLYDMALNIEYTGAYPQTIPLELDETAEDLVILGRELGLEAFEMIMAGQTSSSTLGSTSDQAGTDETLVPPLTEAHFAGQSGHAQHGYVSRWVSEVPGYRDETATECSQGTSLLSDYTETQADYDNSDWVNVSTGSVSIDQNTQGAGSKFSSFLSCASYSDELELD